MILLFATLIGTFAVGCLGYLVSSLLTKKDEVLEKFGLSIPLGFGIFTLFIFFYSLTGIRINLLTMSMTLIILLSVSYLLARNKLKKPDWKFLLGWTLLQKILLLAILGTIAVSLIHAVYYPVSAWDALTLYDFRAKIILQEGHFTQIANNFSTNFSYYPLLTSLIHVWIYALGGNNPQFVYSLYFLSFLIIFYSLVLRNSTKTIALISTFALGSTPILYYHSTFAYTNLPYTIYMASGLLYLFLFLANKSVKTLILSALLVGLSTWSRSAEQFWVTPLLVWFVYSLFKKQFLPVIVYSLVFFAVRQPWSIFLSGLYGSYYSISTQAVTAGKVLAGGQVDFSRFMEVLRFIYQNVILGWGPVWILFIFCLILELLLLRRTKRLIFVAVVGINLGILIAGTYFLGLRFKDWRDLTESASRSSMFFIPLFLYYIGTSDIINRLFFGTKKQA